MHWKHLRADELAVLLAMLEIGDSSGQILYPAIPRIARYTKLSERTVQRALHGTPARTRRSGRHEHMRPGMIDRHWLALIAPANATSRRAATYRLQLEAIPDDLAMIRDAIRRRWRIPPEIVAGLPAELAQQISPQHRLPFPVDQVEIDKWVHHNPGAWRRIRQDLNNAKEARLGTPGDWTPAAAATLMRQICVSQGMPFRLAEALATTWKTGG